MNYYTIDGYNFSAYRSENSARPIVLINTRHLPFLDIDYAYSHFKILYHRDYKINHEGESKANDYLATPYLLLREELGEQFVKSERKTKEFDGLLLERDSRVGVRLSGELSGHDANTRYWVIVAVEGFYNNEPIFLFNSREMSEEATDKMVEWAIEILRKDIECGAHKGKIKVISEGRRRYEYEESPYDYSE